MPLDRCSIVSGSLTAKPEFTFTITSVAEVASYTPQVAWKTWPAISLNALRNSGWSIASRCNSQLPASQLVGVANRHAAAGGMGVDDASARRVERTGVDTEPPLDHAELVGIGSVGYLDGDAAAARIGEDRSRRRGEGELYATATRGSVDAGRPQGFTGDSAAAGTQPKRPAGADHGDAAARARCVDGARQVAQADAATAAANHDRDAGGHSHGVVQIAETREQHRARGIEHESIAGDRLAVTRSRNPRRIEPSMTISLLVVPSTCTDPVPLWISTVVIASVNVRWNSSRPNDNRSTTTNTPYATR